MVEKYELYKQKLIDEFEKVRLLLPPSMYKYVDTALKEIKQDGEVEPDFLFVETADMKADINELCSMFITNTELRRKLLADCKSEGMTELTIGQFEYLLNRYVGIEPKYRKAKYEGLAKLSRLHTLDSLIDFYCNLVSEGTWVYSVDSDLVNEIVNLRYKWSEHTYQAFQEKFHDSMLNVTFSIECKGAMYNVGVHIPSSDTEDALLEVEIRQTFDYTEYPTSFDVKYKLKKTKNNKYMLHLVGGDEKAYRCICHKSCMSSICPTPEDVTTIDLESNYIDFINCRQCINCNRVSTDNIPSASELKYVALFILGMMVDVEYMTYKYGEVATKFLLGRNGDTEKAMREIYNLPEVQERLKELNEEHRHEEEHKEQQEELVETIKLPITTNEFIDKERDNILRYFQKWDNYSKMKGKDRLAFLNLMKQLDFSDVEEVKKIFTSALRQHIFKLNRLGKVKLAYELEDKGTILINLFFKYLSLDNEVFSFNEDLHKEFIRKFNVIEDFEKDRGIDITNWITNCPECYNFCIRYNDIFYRCIIKNSTYEDSLIYVCYTDENVYYETSANLEKTKTGYDIVVNTDDCYLIRIDEKEKVKKESKDYIQVSLHIEMLQKKLLQPDDLLRLAFQIGIVRFNRKYYQDTERKEEDNKDKVIIDKPDLTTDVVIHTVDIMDKFSKEVFFKEHESGLHMQGKKHENGHRSPREHERRGHIRHLKSGKVVQVKSTTVNKGHTKTTYKIV